MRAFQYATILHKHGIDTPEPVAYLEERREGLLRESWLITIQCPYAHLPFEMGTAEPDVYEPVAKALAAFTAHMHEESIVHKDFSPGNILWDKDKDGHIVFSLVDINRMYFGPVDIHRGCANFARLWGPKRFIEQLVRTYAGIRSKQIRYSAIVLHLDHQRPYVNEEAWKRNNAIRRETKEKHLVATEYGL